MQSHPPIDGVIGLRALNRATLDRQLLLRRSPLSVTEAVAHLVGLQAQTPHTAYVGLWGRLEGFRPEQLSDRLVDRSVVRMALMRGTIHLVSARDAWGLRQLVQPVLDRVQKGQFGKHLVGIDEAELVSTGRTFIDSEPRTFKALGDHLLERWPDRDRFAMEQAIRTAVPLVQVPPRGLWGRSGPIAHTSIEAWLGEPPVEPLTIDSLVLRYLGAFGPASVLDAQAWCGLTRLRDVFDRLRPSLVVLRDEAGRELFDLPDAPRPDAGTPAPPRFLYDFENLLLSYADRSRTGSPDVAKALAPRNQEPVSAFMLDGFVAGRWTISRVRRAAILHVTPVKPLSAADVAGLTEEGHALLGFAANEADDRDVRIEPALSD